jgi:hypothetical protein
MAEDCVSVINKVRSEVEADFNSPGYKTYIAALQYRDFRINRAIDKLASMNRTYAAQLADPNIPDTMKSGMQFDLDRAEDDVLEAKAITVDRPVLPSDIYRGMNLTCMNCPTNISMAGDVKANLESIQQTTQCIASAVTAAEQKAADDLANEPPDPEEDPNQVNRTTAQDSKQDIDIRGGGAKPPGGSGSGSGSGSGDTGAGTGGDTGGETGDDAGDPGEGDTSGTGWKPGLGTAIWAAVACLILLVGVILAVRSKRRNDE